MNVYGGRGVGVVEIPQRGRIGERRCHRAGGGREHLYNRPGVKFAQHGRPELQAEVRGVTRDKKDVLNPHATGETTGTN